jgi:hypothetical protein
LGFSLDFAHNSEGGEKQGSLKQAQTLETDS